MVQAISTYSLIEPPFPILPIFEMHTKNAKMATIKTHGTSSLRCYPNKELSWLDICPLLPFPLHHFDEHIRKMVSKYEKVSTEKIHLHVLNYIHGYSYRPIWHVTDTIRLGIDMIRTTIELCCIMSSVVPRIEPRHGTNNPY